MTSMEPRLLQRRKRVAEDRAQRNIRRLLRLLATLFVAGSLVWVMLSPWLSVHQVHTTGVQASDAHQILTRENVVAGTPMILLRPGAIERSLESDPWVSEAQVTLQWPNDVLVTITERIPLAWVETGDGWSRHAVDGVSLPSPDTPDDTLPRVRLPSIPGREATSSPLLLGALEFLNVVSPERRPGVEVTGREDELWAEVDGFSVQLGRPVEMLEKGLSLEALLEERLTEGSTLILIAPSHPAVRPPEPETEEEEVAETENEKEDSNDQVEP